MTGQVSGAESMQPVQSETQASHQMHQDHSEQSSGWRIMQDGVVFLTANRQDRPRGDTELVSQNWWMGMASRSIAVSYTHLTLPTNREL